MEGVFEQLDEGWGGEELLAVAELEVDVACGLCGIGPDNWMVAHLDIGLGGVAGLIDTGQNADVGTGAAVVGVPLVIGDDKGSRKVAHHGMQAVFYLYGGVALLGYVILEEYAAHEV